MKAMEMKELPISAGKANIEWKEGTFDPSRKNHTLFLPYREELEWYPLKEGLQFLFRCGYRSQTISRSSLGRERLVPRVFFGGTDENPFLVEIHAHLLRIYLQYGEEAFYKALVPVPILVAKEISKREYVRQGDIFACPVPWLNFEREYKTRKDIQRFNVSASLFMTRHTLRGRGFTLVGVRPFYEDILDPKDIVLSRLFRTTEEILVIGEGTIECPDHSSLILKEPHLIAQTRFLFDPKRAD